MRLSQKDIVYSSMSLCAIACLTTLICFAQARAAAVDSPQKTEGPQVLLISRFSGVVGDQAETVVRHDLDHVSIFSEVREAGVSNPPVDINVLPDFRSLSADGVRFYLVGTTSKDETTGQVEVQARLWDIASQKQLIGNKFVSSGENLRRTSHLIADAVQQKLTGERSYFDTHLAYVNTAQAGLRRLAVSDYDGAREVVLTTGKYPVADPKYYSDLLIAYTAQLDGQPRVMLFAPQNGKQKQLTSSIASTRMPAFAPNGRTVALICDDGARANICLVATATGELLRTISHNAKDAYPTFSPDGKRIAFESDMNGHSAVFTVDELGNDLRRVGDVPDDLSMPVWSPDGSQIAVVRQSSAGTRIAVLHPSGTGLHDVSTGMNDTMPSWAPNGEAIVFTRRSPTGDQLWIVDVFSHAERQVEPLGPSSNAGWSQFP